MKHFMVLGLLTFVVLVSGCVDSQFIKSIAVEKDADGKVVKVTETETAIQPARGWPIKFEYLKNIQSLNSEATESSQSGYEYRKVK